jgi:hypothetical protein
LSRVGAKVGTASGGTEEPEVLAIVTERPESRGIPYTRSGAFAGSYCAVPRITREIEIVIEVSEADADQLCSLFENDFYGDRDAARRALARRTSLNVIHTALVRARPRPAEGQRLAEEERGRSRARRAAAVGGGVRLKALARHRMAGAPEAFAEGDHLLATGAARGSGEPLLLRGVVAARPLLATREMDSSKHSGVIALFQRHFVKTGHFDVETSRALARALQKRQKTDYADFATVTAKETQTVRGEVEAFVRECERVFDHLAATDDG